MISYTPQALAGFAAERYSIGLKEGWEIAQSSIHEKLRNHIESYVRSHWRADRVKNTCFSTLYSKITYKYLLVPVWISSFKYKDKIYHLVVNGQTGKVGGRAPVSVWKVLLTVALSIGAIVGLVLLLR